MGFVGEAFVSILGLDGNVIRVMGLLLAKGARSVNEKFF